MAMCEMCGKEGSLSKVTVEGALLDLCQACSKFGVKQGGNRHHGKDKKIFINKRRYDAPESNDKIVDDFASIIKNKREELNLKQIELAKKLSEKESLVHKLEAGGMRPPFALAKKLQKLLGIKLIEKIDDGSNDKDKEDNKSFKKGSPNSAGFTLGDFIKKKK